MNIEFNGKTIETKAENLTELLAERDIDPTTVATAVDGDFVPRSHYDRQPLIAEMKLEVLSPKQGG
jgi:sulfur carrier protein